MQTGHKREHPKGAALANYQQEAIKSIKIRDTNPALENSKSFPVLEKIMRATSASQRTDSSCAFFSNPTRRFEKVTCLLVAFSILLISIFPLPISPFSSTHPNPKKTRRRVIYLCRKGKRKGKKEGYRPRIDSGKERGLSKFRGVNEERWRKKKRKEKGSA